MSERASQSETDPVWSCPSTTASDPDARVFGVVLGSLEQPEVVYLTQPVPLSTQRDTLADDVTPTEMYRLVGGCARSACQHYSGSHCKLGAYVASELAAVTRALPPCSIRHECRWFHEQKARACLRCPQVVTEVTSIGTSAASRREKRQLPVV